MYIDCNNYKILDSNSHIFKRKLLEIWFIFYLPNFLFCYFVIATGKHKEDKLECEYRTRDYAIQGIYIYILRNLPNIFVFTGGSLYFDKATTLKNPSRMCFLLAKSLYFYYYFHFFSSLYYNQIMQQVFDF